MQFSFRIATGSLVKPKLKTPGAPVLPADLTAALGRAGCRSCYASQFSSIGMLLYNTVQQHWVEQDADPAGLHSSAALGRAGCRSC